MEYNAENILTRTIALRKEFGSSKKLAEAAGCTLSFATNCCSPKYLEKHLPDKKKWERYFGKWDVELTIHEEKADQIEEAAVEEETKEEPKAEKPEKKTARIIIEVPSLEELEETLTQFGFRLEFVAR